MARVRNTRLIDAELGSIASRRYGGLRANKISSRIEQIAAREMRASLKAALAAAMIDARTSGGPSRTGKGLTKAVAGARAFGTNFANLRGHILAPSYLDAHNTGATIYPTQGDWLAVPLDEALRADGSPKLPGPRSWQVHGSFIWKSPKTGKLLIVRKVKGEKNLRFLYVLVESVTMTKHRGWADRAWGRQLPLLMSVWDSIVASYISPAMVGEAYSVGLSGRK